MKIDFFNQFCREKERKELTFGLCDRDDGTPSYSDTRNPSSWIGIVDNSREIALTFIPVDNCVIKSTDLVGVRRCDGILFSYKHLYFVELKCVRHSWIQEAIMQLESTIELFKNSHNLNEFKDKKAFVCNRRRVHFQVVDNELNITFFRRHGVRLDIQANILIVD